MADVNEGNNKFHLFIVVFSFCRFFLFGGIVMAILGVGNFILFCFAFSLASVTGFKYNTR